MPATTKVLLHTDRLAAEPVTVEPEATDFQRGEEIELVLETVGGDGQRARFPSSGAVAWQDPASADAFAEPDRSAAGDRLTLRNRSEAASSQVVRYGYRVTVEFDGKLYSTQGYPTVEEHPPVGGGG